MEVLKFNLDKKCGNFKILNATNGGPWYNRHRKDQKRTNFKEYKEACIPYSRNHDSGISGMYGGPFSHDVTRIFPNFDADPDDPSSYDFPCTDEAILACLDAGTKTFFRLGQSIEHQIVKHYTKPPKDFGKWAVICEHIIRHYTEGWADGFELDMPYWEIWNEPDLDPDDSTNKRNWGGTKAQFFDFYETASKHLKKSFPHLKIGGPALAGKEDWADEFLCEMQKRNVEIDFFSWHIYGSEPWWVYEKAERIKGMLIKYGYEKAESICNEWNYIENWEDKYQYSVNMIHGSKGAAFMMAVICEAQRSSMDMLMYYDTRQSAFNGAFDFYSYKPLKGYYALMWYGKFYNLKNEIKAENKIDDIYSICGVDENGKAMAVITYYSDNDDAGNKKISVDFGKNSEFEIYLVDKAHDGDLVMVSDKLEFDMEVNTFILIKERQ